MDRNESKTNCNIETDISGNPFTCECDRLTWLEHDVDDLSCASFEHVQQVGCLTAGKDLMPLVR